MFDFKANPRIDIMKRGELDKAINLVHKGYNNLKARTHLAMIGCYDHALKHGDLRPLTRLFDNMPANANLTSMKAHVLKYTSFRWDEKTDQFKAQGKKNEKEFNVSPEAYTTPFYEMKIAANDPKAWEFMSKLDAFFKSCQNHTKDMNEHDKALFNHLLNSKVDFAALWEKQQREPRHPMKDITPAKARGADKLIELNANAA